MKLFRHQHKLSIKHTQITLLFRQLATLINAGVPLIQSINILETSQSNPQQRILLYTLKQDLLSGHHLSAALARHLHSLDKATCTMIKIGEQTGKLDSLLTQITDAREQRDAFKKQIKQQLFYPSFIAAFALIITLALFLIVIPQFAELFKEKSSQLPLITRILFSASEFTIDHGLLLLFITCSIISSPLLSHKLRTTLITQLKSLPGIKNIITKTHLARFARQLAIQHEAGISLLDSLQLLINDTHQSTFTTIIRQVRHHIETGMQLHQSLRQSKHFPPLMTQLIKIGEESGTLDANLYKIAYFLETEIHQSLQQLCKLAEPLIMLLLGALIGGLVIGLYLPIFRLGNIL